MRFKYKGFEGEIEKSSWMGYFTWNMSSEEGELSDPEGGDLNNYANAKDFIKSQINAFLAGDFTAIHRGIKVRDKRTNYPNLGDDPADVARMLHDGGY